MAMGMGLMRMNCLIKDQINVDVLEHLSLEKFKSKNDSVLKASLRDSSTDLIVLGCHYLLKWCYEVDGICTVHNGHIAF